ncbi:hypothetical protein GGI35DRAFT_7597 [Trichoderma velutinum]
MSSPSVFSNQPSSPNQIRFDHPFDVTALSIARLALTGWCVYLAKMGQWHVKDSGRHQMAISALHWRANSPGRACPLRRHQKRGARRGCLPQWLDVFGHSQWGCLEAAPPHPHPHPQANPASKPPFGSHCPLTLDWGHAVRERGSVPELPLGSIQEAFIN